MAIFPESVLTPANLFGAATVTVAAGFSLPQLVQLRRGNVAGVSIAAVTNTAISFLAWTVYAVWVSDDWLLTSSLVGLPGTIATAVIAFRRGGDRGSFRLPALWVLALLAVAAVQAAGVVALVPLVVGTSIVWTVIPALATAWRSGDVSGIAAGSWCVQAGEGLLYLGYGLTQHEQASTSYAVACLVGSAGMLSRLAVAHPARRAPARRARTRGTWDRGARWLAITVS